jgi:hypothetical protein
MIYEIFDESFCCQSTMPAPDPGLDAASADVASADVNILKKSSLETKSKKQLTSSKCTSAASLEDEVSLF